MVPISPPNHVAVPVVAHSHVYYYSIDLNQCCQKSKYIYYLAGKLLAGINIAPYSILYILWPYAVYYTFQGG